MTPAGLKCSESHEWVRIEGETAVVGITDHAQKSLGDITFVDLPKAGQAVRQGEVCGVIESVKAASDLYAPVSGVVSEVNGALESALELINEDPYGRGWFYKLRGVRAAEAEALLGPDEYEARVRKEEG